MSANRTHSDELGIHLRSHGPLEGYVHRKVHKSNLGPYSTDNPKFCVHCGKCEWALTDECTPTTIQAQHVQVFDWIGTGAGAFVQVTQVIRRVDDDLVRITGIFRGAAGTMALKPDFLLYKVTPHVTRVRLPDGTELELLDRKHAWLR